MIIGVDFDNVMNELLETWCEYLNKKVTPEHMRDWHDITDWNMINNYPTLDEFTVFSVLRDATFWFDVRPKLDAIKKLECLQQRGHQIVVITAAPVDTVSVKCNMCLFRHFPYISWKDVIITSQKHLIDVDVLIDDYPENLRNCKNTTRCLLYKEKYNEYAWQDFECVNNWAEIANIIKEMEKNL